MRLNNLYVICLVIIELYRIFSRQKLRAKNKIDIVQRPPVQWLSGTSGEVLFYGFRRMLIQLNPCETIDPSCSPGSAFMSHQR